jgi:L-asparagine permease
VTTLSPPPARPATRVEQGYHKALKPRQIQMIAIGGAIGTGLFLGAGGRLATAGPALLFVYALAGFMGFLILRALGELILHRPTSSSARRRRTRSAGSTGWPGPRSPSST